MHNQKTLLLVAIPNSIHTARWVGQIMDQGWDIHLFPSMAGAPIHPEITGVTVHYLAHNKRVASVEARLPSRTSLFSRAMFALKRRVLDERFPKWRAGQLARVVRRLRPDIVHAMEIQGAGYLTLEARKILGGRFPPWIMTNWGSDIYLFGRLQAHRERIRDVLEHCDYYSCECKRDVALAREFGFKKDVLPVIPNTGGFDLRRAGEGRRQIVTSDRRIIMLKGYQGWAGRALVGLRALERCADLLKKYSIVIYSAVPDVVMAAELFTDRTGIATRILPASTPHEEILSCHAQARISIGLSIGDAISTSLLEAMVMGSFPIQSCTACADEWVQHGVSAFIVPPEDPDVIEAAIRTALTDDELVNSASEINWQVSQARLDKALLKEQVVQMYRDSMK